MEFQGTVLEVFDGMVDAARDRVPAHALREVDVGGTHGGLGVDGCGGESDGVEGGYEARGGFSVAHSFDFVVGTVEFYISAGYGDEAGEFFQGWDEFYFGAFQVLETVLDHIFDDCGIGGFCPEDYVGGEVRAFHAVCPDGDEAVSHCGHLVAEFGGVDFGCGAADEGYAAMPGEDRLAAFCGYVAVIYAPEDA